MRNGKFVFVFSLLVAAVLVKAEASVFSDNFDDGDISDWTVVTDGQGIFETSNAKYWSGPYSVHMKSLNEGDKAMGTSPSYDVNLAENYDVSFRFLIPGTNNHWFEVLNNHQIYLVIDSGDDFKCYDGSTGYLIDELATDQWHFIEIKARPSSNSYNVYVNSQFKKSCSMWIHAGFETDFRIGERNNDQTYYDYGQAYWDDFEITQPVDSDGDGIMDPNDNCPYDYNPGQADRNSDGWGDVCECIAVNINNDSGHVDLGDFALIALDWQDSIPPTPGDINSDGVVDFYDLEILAYHWLSDCSEE